MCKNGSKASQLSDEVLQQLIDRAEKAAYSGDPASVEDQVLEAYGVDSTEHILWKTLVTARQWALWTSPVQALRLLKPDSPEPEEVTQNVPMYVSHEVIAAVDRVVLRGHPIEYEGSAVITDDGTRLEHWPLRIKIGSVVLYLMRIYPKNGAQEAQYERRQVEILEVLGE